LHARHLDQAGRAPAGPEIHQYHPPAVVGESVLLPLEVGQFEGRCCDAAYTDINDENTRNTTRRMLIDEKLDQYLVGLRKNDFPVEVNQDMLVQLVQQEVDWYQERNRNGAVSAQQMQEQIKKLRK
jgi:hypothetical protein